MLMSRNLTVETVLHRAMESEKQFYEVTLFAVTYFCSTVVLPASCKYAFTAFSTLKEKGHTMCATLFILLVLLWKCNRVKQIKDT